jgi:nitroreductase
MFIERWSPRSFTGEPMPESDLMTILEAARWAPSASNLQPWRFVYALKGTPEFDAIASSLMGFNQAWAPNASALLIAISKTHIAGPGQTEEKFDRWHSHDTGAATLAIALQANKLGYHAHAMGGVEADKAKEVLGIPAEGYIVESAIAIGKKGPKEKLSAEQQTREIPNGRKPLGEIAFKGKFKI